MSTHGKGKKKKFSKTFSHMAQSTYEPKHLSNLKCEENRNNCIDEVVQMLAMEWERHVSRCLFDILCISEKLSHTAVITWAATNKSNRIISLSQMSRLIFFDSCVYIQCLDLFCSLVIRLFVFSSKQISLCILFFWSKQALKKFLCLMKRFTSLSN